MYFLRKASLKFHQIHVIFLYKVGRHSTYSNYIICSFAASGEPPLTLAVSVHCATRAAILEARRQLLSWNGLDESNATIFQLEVPATMPVVKERCGLDSIQKFLQWTMGSK